MKVEYSNKIDRMTETFFLAAIFALPFSKAVLETCLAVSFISWFVAKILYKEPLCKSQPICFIAGSFIIFSSVSAFYSGYPVLSAQGIVKLIKYILIFFIAMDLFRDPRRWYRLLYVAFVSFAIVVVDAYFQSISGKSIIVKNLIVHHADTQVRLTGPYTSYGLLAAHLLATLPVLLSFTLGMRNHPRWVRMAYFSFFVASIFVLYKTHSRGAWLAALGSYLIDAWLLKSRWMLAVLGVILFVVPLVLPKNALLHVDLYRQEQTLIERNLLWSRAVQVIRANPLFGCGINTYVRNYPRFVQDRDWRIFNLRADADNYDYIEESERWRVPGDSAQIPTHYVHNGYLQLAAETGLISLALFLLLLGQGLRSGYLAFQRSDGQKKFFIAGLLIGFIALLLQAVVDTTLHNLQSAVMIWLFLGLLFAVRAMDDDKRGLAI